MGVVHVEGTTLREEDASDWTIVIGTYQGRPQSKERQNNVREARENQKVTEKRTETLPPSAWRPTYRPNPEQLRATQQVTSRSRRMAPLPEYAIKVTFWSQGSLFMPNIQP
ncbi:hypothetical protein MRX96_041658 [Rhipicephalus microplus]